jgi:hypothetical protein
MHPRAALTLTGRSLLTERVQEQDWTVATAAEAQRYSRATDHKLSAAFRRRGCCRPPRSLKPTAPSPRRLSPEREQASLQHGQATLEGPHRIVKGM